MSMNQINLKPVYADNNPAWRIRYHSNGRWELQEYVELKDGVDRRREQPWRTHNTNMTWDDAIVALGRYHIAKRRA